MVKQAVGDGRSANNNDDVVPSDSCSNGAGFRGTTSAGTWIPGAKYLA